MYFFELGLETLFPRNWHSLTYDSDELALLFTGAPAPAAAKENATIRVIEETDEARDPESRSIPSSPPELSTGMQPDSATPLSTDVESSFLLLSTDLELPSQPSHGLGGVHPIISKSPTGDPPLFSIEQLGVDRRLIVNRKRQLKMYRVWMQGKFKKL